VLIIMFVLMMAFDFVTNRTTIGRRIYALGGNEKAARLSGIKTERLSFYTFVNMGVLAALAGLIFAARLNTATPKAGVGFELDVIAACFIGGASATGGVGKVMGAVIGAFVMGVMNNGMSILGIGIDYQQVIKGVVLRRCGFCGRLQQEQVTCLRSGRSRGRARRVFRCEAALSGVVQPGANDGFTVRHLPCGGKESV
jgi:ABC-type xylose transport system permease subunit